MTTFRKRPWTRAETALAIIILAIWCSSRMLRDTLRHHIIRIRFLKGGLLRFPGEQVRHWEKDSRCTCHACKRTKETTCFRTLRKSQQWPQEIIRRWIWLRMARKAVRCLTGKYKIWNRYNSRPKSIPSCPNRNLASSDSHNMILHQYIPWEQTRCLEIRSSISKSSTCHTAKKWSISKTRKPNSWISESSTAGSSGLKLIRCTRHSMPNWTRRDRIWSGNFWERMKRVGGALEVSKPTIRW